jgi:outer membrane protein insertion porin family
MKKKEFQFTTAILFFLIFLTGCNVTKHLKSNETLYTGGKVTINNTGKIPEKKTVRQSLEELIPKANTKIFGMRPKLWVYYNVDPGDKKKGLKAFLRKKFSEPPVLIEDINTENLEKRMLNLLINRGYFQARVQSEAKEKNKKADLHFNVAIKAPYRIKELIYPTGNSKIDSQIALFKKETLLRPDDVFSLEKLKEERDRIDGNLKELGYFYFNPDFLLFQVDSTMGDRTVKIRLAIKEEVPEKARLTYKMNRIIMNPDYEVADTIDRSQYNRIRVDSITFLKKGNGQFRPKALTRLVFLKEDSLYSRQDHNITLNRLMGLDVFKYVNIRFRERDSIGPGLLNAAIQMSPLMKKSLRAEVQGYTKSTNFAGPAIQFSFKNRNAFRGAELLLVNLNTGFETQFTGEYKGYYSYEIQPQVQILLPRFLLPFNITPKKSLFVPRTKIETSYRLQNIINRYKQNSFNLIYGYEWKETVAREHQLNPINLSYLNFDIADSFEVKLKEIPYLRRNFENQVILGGMYNYTYNNLLEKAGRGRHHFYFNGNLDVSGNLMNVAEKVLGKENGKFWGKRYNQYLRNEIDFRYYHDLSSTERLATRLNIGLGYAYGNSRTLPIVKQFYAGGPSGIRAFRARTIGPGTFRDPDQESAFFTQLGDLKLEGNLEYRFDLISILKGAVFVDAGNTWLRKGRELGTSGSDTLSTEGVFDSKTFLKEIAVGTGFGFRVDVTFLILRLDIAFPVRKFYKLDYRGENREEYSRKLEGSDRWVIGSINPFDPDWRKDNLVLNIAIGYPF